MSERVKLNKVSLREQKQKLAMYRRFLPALEARKQQFLMQLALTRKEIARQEVLLEERLTKIRVWAGLLGEVGALLKNYLAIKEIKFTMRNIAGLKIRCFEGVVFHDPAYSYFATPYSFETMRKELRSVVSAKEEISMLIDQAKLLMDGFRKTSQRINLYEQRLIPGCREAIRKVTVYLQDQQAAAVGVAKVAKRMLEDSMQSSGG